MKSDPIIRTKKIDFYGKPATLTVYAGLRNIKGNHAPYFSLTGDVQVAGERDIAEGGSIHARILEHFPELKPLADLHLSDINGVPMHAEANGQYFADQGDIKALASHARISEEKARGIIERKDPVRLLVAESMARWKREAIEAISTFGLKVYGDTWAAK